MQDKLSLITLAVAKKYIKELEGVGLKNARLDNGHLIFTLSDEEELDIGNINDYFINDYDIESHKTYSSEKIESIFQWTQYTTEITNANEFSPKGKNAFATLYGGNCANLPENNRWFMVEWHGSDIGLSVNGYGFQIARTVGASIQGKTYIRYKNQNDNWTDWQKTPQIPTDTNVIVIKNDNAKMEFGETTTNGITRILTLKNEYSSMKYFNVVFTDFNALPIRNVEFVSPNKVKFQIKTNSGYDFATDLTLKYMFVGI